MTVFAPDIIHAPILRGFAELVGELGGDAAALLAGVGLDGAAIERGETSYRQLIRLLDRAATTLACPDFGMRLARLQGGAGAFGPIGDVMRNSRTFGEAIRYVSDHAYAHSPAAGIWLRRLIDEEAVLVTHVLVIEEPHDRAQLVEQILLVGHLGAMEITGGRTRVRRVLFRHQPRSPLRLYRRYFGCEVLFGQVEDGVVFGRADLDQPVIDADGAAYASATAFIDRALAGSRPPLRAQVHALVMKYLGREDCSNDRIARELCLHSRTLHRRLAAEGASFQGIKDAVRRDLAAYYLRHTDFDLTRIAERLGFSEQSVLTRRCRAWFAAPPTAVRARA
jgi:AraC-like DNA-binding protein